MRQADATESGSAVGAKTGPEALLSQSSRMPVSGERRGY